MNSGVAGQMHTCHERPFTSAADVFLPAGTGQELRGVGIVFLCAGHVFCRRDKNKLGGAGLIWQWVDVYM